MALQAAMAGSEDPKQDVLCCPECGEEHEKEEDGTYPNFCEGCGADFSRPAPLKKCPKCQKDRKKKKGQYVKNCGGCGLNYAEAEGSASTSSSAAGKKVMLQSYACCTPATAIYGRSEPKYLDGDSRFQLKMEMMRIIT